MQQCFGRVVNDLGEEWDEDRRNAGTISDRRDLRMTPSRSDALNEELMAVIARHTPAPGAESVPSALPVIVQLRSVPRKERGTT